MKNLRNELIAFLEKLGESIAVKVKEKESTDRLLSLLDTINEGIALTDSEGKIIQYNNVLNQMLINKENINQIMPTDFFENIFEDNNCTGNNECEVELKVSNQNVRMFVSAKRINEGVCDEQTPHNTFGDNNTH